MKQLFTQALLIVLVLAGTFSFSQRVQADTNLYVAFTRLYHFPGSIRVGFDDWEFGLINHLSYGVNKVFRINKNYYTAFGPVVTIAGEPALGIYAAIGFDYKLGAGFGFRGEFNSVQNFNGFSKGDAYLGVSFRF